MACDICMTHSWTLGGKAGAKLLGGRLKQASYAVSLLQVLQEVFLGSEELCADMAPANLNFV